jgi:hypothetical protein
MRRAGKIPSLMQFNEILSVGFLGGIRLIDGGEKFSGKYFWRKSLDSSEKADCSLGTIGLFEPKNS